MKIITAITIFCLLFIGGVATAQPQPQTPPDEKSIIGQLLNSLSIEEVNNFIVKINRELDEDIPQLNLASIQQIADKGLELDWATVKQVILSRFFREMAVNIHLMGKLIFLAVLSALLQNLLNSFERSTISLLAYSICYIFMLVIALTAFFNALTLARTTVEAMVGFMEALLPLLISLLAGVGAVTSAALFTPMMMFVVTSVSIIVKDVVLPLLFLAAVLQCVNYFSDHYRLSNLSNLLRQVGMVVQGFTMVIFVGIITIQGVAGGVADGIGLRTAKYAASTFIPVVGKMFADTVELVMGASLLVKNAIGIFGIVMVFTICVFPLIKLISLILIMKVAGALVQPLGDERTANSLDVMGNNLMLIFVAVLTVALMLFLAITIIIGVGSMTMMLR
ncbi:MAG: stage sporulation protein [Firmicutes bacterium]|nr:stage sporulation protein [Bacillota bacterium]